jgi:hypothetical protein
MEPNEETTKRIPIWTAAGIVFLVLVELFAMYHQLTSELN